MGIIFSIEIVEGKDSPGQIGRTEFYEEGGTVLIVLQLTKSLFGTGKLVILDSGFCVLKAIVSLKKWGVYASALIKNIAIGQHILTGQVFKTSLTTNSLDIKHVCLER